MGNYTISGTIIIFKAIYYVFVESVILVATNYSKLGIPRDSSDVCTSPILVRTTSMTMLSKRSYYNLQYISQC